MSADIADTQVSCFHCLIDSGSDTLQASWFGSLIKSAEPRWTICFNSLGNWELSPLRVWVAPVNYNQLHSHWTTLLVLQRKEANSGNQTSDVDSCTCSFREPWMRTLRVCHSHRPFPSALLPGSCWKMKAKGGGNKHRQGDIQIW